MNYPNKETPKKNENVEFPTFQRIYRSWLIGGAIEKIRTRIR